MESCLVLLHVEMALNGVECEVCHAVRLRRQQDLADHVRLGCAPKQAPFCWPQRSQQPCLPWSQKSQDPE